MAGSLALAVSWAGAGGTGLPSRAPDLDVMPGFKNPPPGYGEVPFWWWTGDPLDADRMIVQLGSCTRKGSAACRSTTRITIPTGWLTDQDAPAIFSDEWWEVYGKISQAARSSTWASA